MATTRSCHGCRKRLLAAGYLPLPVNGKEPPIKGWQDIAATNKIIGTWETKYADATNTGILTRTTPAIDIDITHPGRRRCGRGAGAGAFRGTRPRHGAVRQGAEARDPAAHR